MKNLSLLTALTLLMYTGCESLNENEVTLDDPELLALSEGLNADIGLSKSSDDAFKDALSRHGKRGRHRMDPGFLWKVAAEMQDKLTQDEKDRLFAWMDDNAVPYLHSPEKDKHHGPKGDKGGMDFRLLFTVLDADQQETLKGILDSYREQMEAVWGQMKDGSMDEATGKAELEALELAMKTEVESLLTDDQKDQLDAIYAEMKDKMEAEKNAEYDAMVTALNMTSEQEASLIVVNQQHKDAVEALMEAAKNSGADVDRAQLGEKIKALMLERNTNLEALFDDKQLETIKVHMSLAMMFSKHCDGRKDGRWGDSDDKGGSTKR